MAFNFPQNPALNQTYEYGGSVYKWNGSVWVLISGSSTLPLHSIVSISPPSRPISGLLWYNPSNETLKVWVPTVGGGGGWQAINDNADCLYKPPVTVSVSSPSNPVVGDLWYNPSSNILKVRVSGVGGDTWEVAGEEPCPEEPTVIVSNSPPGNPSIGDLWFNTSELILYIRVSTPMGATWQSAYSPDPCPEVPTVIVSGSEPQNPQSGDLWFNTVSTTLYLWVPSLTGGEWQNITDPESCPESVPVSVSASPPVSPNVGDLWFDTINLTLFVRVSTPSGDEWQPATNPEDCTPEINFPRIIVSSGYPTNPIEGDLWFNPDTIGLSVWYTDIDGGQWVSLIREPGPPDLSDDDPQPLGAASPGISLLPSRSDHVHPMPSIDNLLGLNTTGKIDKSVIYYDAPNNEFKADSILTQYTLTDGGNF